MSPPLTTQAQELYERMQKQSKNHVARAKRSVQGGHSPDEDLLLKAQKSCRELLEVDSEKVREPPHRNLLTLTSSP